MFVQLPDDKIQGLIKDFQGDRWHISIMLKRVHE